MNHSDSNCIFCKIIERKAESSIVYEDNAVIAFMDLQPVNPGHVLVIPKFHISSLDPSHAEMAAGLFKIGLQISNALKKSSIPANGVNYLLADGEAAGQEVFHAHLHIFPRFKGDGFGFRFSEKYYQPTERKELDSLAEEIRKNLI